MPNRRKTTQVLICIGLQIAHAVIAYKAGLHIFEDAHYVAFELAGLQLIPAITVDLFEWGILMAMVKHRKTLHKICPWVNIYLVVLVLVECYLLTLGTPLSYEITQFLAYSSMVVNSSVAIWMLTKLYPK